MARMHITAQERVQVKLACLRLLAGQTLDARRRQVLASVVSISLPLTDQQNEQLRQELQAVSLEERRPVMGLMSEWERKGWRAGHYAMALRLL